MLASDCFLKFDSEVLSHIGALDRLACLEGELFEACMRRIEALGKDDGSAKEVAKTEIRKLLKVFRFGSMSNDELNSLSSLYHNLFSYDEYREIFHLIVSNEFQPMILNGNRKKRIEEVFEHNKNNLIACHRKVSTYDSSHDYHIKPVETTTFSTNKSILLSRFVCDKISWRNGQINLSADFTIFEISNLNDSNERVTLHSGTIQANSTGKLLITRSSQISYESRSRFLHQFSQK